MSRTDRSPIVSLARGIGLAAWTWVVFAALAAAVLVSAPRPPGAAGPSSYLDAFASVLAFDFGPSLWYGKPALDVVIERLGPTLTLLVETLVVAAVLGAALVALARRNESGRRVAEALGYLGGLPAAAWLLGLLWLGTTAGLPVPLAAGGDSVAYWPAALALALPVAGVVGRVAVRGTDDRGWVLDGWLAASWLLGTLVVVETILGIPGLGALLLDALAQRDASVLVAASAVLLLVALLASVVREVAWSGGGADPGSTAGLTDDSVRADGGAVVSPERVLRTNRRMQVGLVGVGALLAVSVLGNAVLSPNPMRSAFLPWTVAGLADVLSGAVFAGVVAAVVGVPFGLLSARVDYGRALSALVVGFAANVPLLLWIWLFVLTDTPFGVPAEALLGLAVAPLVAAAAGRDLANRETVAPGALLPALGVAATGAGVVAIVVAQPQMLGVVPDHWLTVDPLNAGESALRLALAVGPPALALFVLGEGLRRA